MKKQLLSVLVSASLFGAASTGVFAEVPNTMSYQGYLTDSSDEPVQGAQDVTFKLYDTSGTEIWSETIQITVTDGVFEATLGQQQSLPAALQQGTSLGVTLGANAEMTPRQALNSTPFAIHAKTTESDTLNSLSCTLNQVAKWDGTKWGCADDQLGQTGGVQTITTGNGLSSNGTDTVNISIDTAGVTANHIGDGQVVKGLSVNGNVVKDTVTLNAGSRVSLSQSGNTVTINAETGGPASIATTSGLSGGGNSGDVTVGIAPAGVQAPMIADGQLVKGVTVGASQLKDNVTFAAGSGVSLVPHGNTVTISTIPGANTVTTDTSQTISGTKTFNSPLSIKSLIGDVFVGSQGNYERLEVFGDVEVKDYSTGTTHLELGVNQGQPYLSNPQSGGNIHIGDDLYLNYPGSSTMRDLHADDVHSDTIETEQITMIGGRVRFYSADETRYGGFIQEDQTYGLEINPSGNDTVYIADNLRVGDDAWFQDNISVEDDAFKTGGGTWDALSDVRLKKNIKKMSSSSALEKITELKPVRYEWINPNEHGGKLQEYGFVAQEVEKIFPDWVTDAELTGEDVNLIVDKAKAISFPHEYNAYVISALQELKKQNELLKVIVCEDHPEKELCQ